ncbi:MAG: UbiH/UbiF/VisC/COQ6 family ubiquinone biosynthesis hydroxylase [Paracoccaceae bacterium]
MTYDSDILIAGGGLNGSALALALAQNGLSVTIIDARAAPARADVGFDGRTYALAAGSKRLLVALGLWSGLASKVQPILQIKVSDGLADQGAAPFFLTFDAAEIEEGPMGFIVEDRHLYANFLNAIVAHPNINLMSGTMVTGQILSSDRMHIELSTGQSLAGRLLIGCDGRESPTAERANIQRQGWAYGQTALVTALHHSLPHNGIAHQYFMPAGPLAILPLVGDHMSSIVWSEERSTAIAIQSLSDRDYLAALAPRFGDFLGNISLAGPRFTYPLSLSLAQSYVAGRLALVGDAAHGVHPIAGQGLNLGLRDAAALAEVLILAKRRGEDLGARDVLARYQNWRRFDTTVVALGMDGINRLFSNANPMLRAARSLGLGIVNDWPKLRQSFMRQAAGLTGDLPILMTGKCL